MGRKKKETPSEWESLKSGAMKHSSGWYANEYLNGWYFYTNSVEVTLGPYKTFQEGLKDWKKQQ